METAPGSLTAERVEAWIRAGINRVSLGVQSFNRQELARTGRKHTAEIVAQDVALLRANGIDNFNIDLIAGLPGQTGDSWAASLASAIALNPPHVSVYMLEVDDDSRLGNEILLGGKRYGANDVPSEDRIGDFYEAAVEELRTHGIHRYEISNFAREGAESIHNLKYWKAGALRRVRRGCSHSFDGKLRWQNVESAQDYVAGSESGRPVRCEESTPDADEEKFFVGLRLSEGVHADAADWQRFGPAFEHFLSTGVMERTSGNLRLTSRGVMVSNEIFQEFITA